MNDRLEIAVPYLAAPFDERTLEERYRRTQLFEVTMAGDVRVEGRTATSRTLTRLASREEMALRNPMENEP